MDDRTRKTRRWGASICLCAFLLAMLVPGPPLPERRDSFPGFATLVVGYFFTGIIFWPAHILFLVGIGKCLAGRVRTALVLSVLAVVAGVCTGGPVVVEQFQKSTLLKYPAVPLWLVSLLLLLALTMMLDASSSVRER